MLPTLFQYEHSMILLYENKAKLIDENNGFSIRSESLFPDNILKATQNSNVVIVTTKNEKYMIDFLSGEVRLANGTVFLRRVRNAQVFVYIHRFPEALRRKKFPKAICPKNPNTVKLEFQI